jgi:hypothetical protein
MRIDMDGEPRRRQKRMKKNAIISVDQEGYSSGSFEVMTLFR